MRKNQLKLGALLSYASLFLGNIVGILYTPIMLRMLGQTEYGLYSLVGSMVSYLSIIDLGIGNSSIRYISKYRALGDKEKEYSLNGMFMVVNTILGIATLIIGVIICNNIDTFFKSGLSYKEIEQLKLMFIILVFNMAIAFPFSNFYSIIISYEHFIFPKVIGMIRTILNPIVVLVILSMGFKSVAMVIVNTIINILFLGVNVYYCFKVLKIKIYFKGFEIPIIKEICNYSIFIFIGIIVDKIYWSTDQFLLGMFSGTTMIAIYSVASQINMYYMQFSTAISGLFLPKITKMVVNNDDDNELTNIFIKVGRIQYIILGLILSGFILYGQEFIILWAGESYRDAYYIALILITPFTVPLIQNIGLTILQAKNMHKFRSIVYLFIALGNLVISIPLAKIYGGIGCALGTAVSMIIGNIIIINIYYYKKININIIIFWREIFTMTIPIIVAVIIGIVLNCIISEIGIINLIIKIILYTITYVLLMYYKGMNRFEKNIIISPIKIIFKNKIKIN